jgi:hypothetical protein
MIVFKAKTKRRRRRADYRRCPKCRRILLVVRNALLFMMLLLLAIMECWLAIATNNSGVFLVHAFSIYPKDCHIIRRSQPANVATNLMMMLHWRKGTSPPPGLPRSAFVDRATWSSRQISTTTTSTRLDMALIPLPVDVLERLVAASSYPLSGSGAPTAAQYSTYWGRTQKERYGRFVESTIVSLLGVFFSYMLSFVLGGFVATLLGTLFLFWAILSPLLKAYQRNWEFYGGRPLVDPWSVDKNNSNNGGGGMNSFFYNNDNNDKQVDPDRAGLYGALLLGRLDDVCVVEEPSAEMEYDLTEFADYRMEDDELERFTGEPYLLRVRVVSDVAATNDSDVDDNVDPSPSPPPRELQIHARLSEEYLDLERGMPVVAILLSLSTRFDRLAAITDLYVPDAACWIGDYPYLDRAEMESLLASDDVIWNALQNEGREPLRQQPQSPRKSSSFPEEFDDDDDMGQRQQSRSSSSNTTMSEYDMDDDDDRRPPPRSSSRRPRRSQTN